MLPAKRIIPCLDVKDGRTVKGVNFRHLKEMGDPAEMGAWYSYQGADELVFLDISASREQRGTRKDWVKQVARSIKIPFSVGGGVQSLEHVYELLDAGADKISINSAALKNPGLITSIASRFGSQCVIAAIDIQFIHHQWVVFMNGGWVPTMLSVEDWAIQAADSGAGEILLTSITHDGKREGFAISIVEIISNLINIPVIASGGAGNEKDFLNLFQKTSASAALAAGIFHDKTIEIPALKTYLKNNKILIR
jgi:imidazole glycerol-phosphate synthase subunit HisF